MPIPNPYTPEEEQMYQELAEKVAYHSQELFKCDRRLFPYYEWKNMVKTTGLTGPNPYTLEEEEEMKLQAAQAAYHLSERAKYDRPLRAYRDMKNVIAYAYQEGLKKARLSGQHEVALQIAGRGLRDGLSLDLIAEATGLSVAELETLRQ